MLALLIACHRVPADTDTPPVDTEQVVDTEDTGVELPGVLRLGPPTPVVGAYGIAATPDTVYVSNLHVPFITLVDPATGAWAGSIDLRDVGIEKTNFPRIYTDDEQLWVVNLETDTLHRWALTDHALLDPVVVGGTVSASRMIDGVLWVATEEGPLFSVTGSAVEQHGSVPGGAEALYVAEDLVSLVFPDERFVRAHALDGAQLWERRFDEPELQQTLVHDGRVYVTSRQAGEVLVLDDGEVAGTVATGSDPFGLYLHEGQVLVTNRQGAELGASGSYEGAPGTVVGLTEELEIDWSVELDKTIHFLAWDGSAMWTTNEDSLNVSAFDPATREVLLTGPRLGLTLDHLAEHGGAYYAGSHLTDELWKADLRERTATGLETCGWPFQAVFVGEVGWTICQESGDLQSFSPEGMTTLEVEDVRGSFHRVCDDGVCAGHDLLVYGAEHDGELVWTEASGPSVRWLDGTVLSLDDQVGGATVQHMGLASLDDLLVFGPVTQQLYRVVDRAIVDAVPIDGVAATDPLVVDGDRVWAGHQAFSAELDEVASIPEGWSVVAAGDGAVVALDDWELASFSGDTLEQTGSLSLRDLRVPPTEIWEGHAGPIVTRIADGELIVGNAFWGTLERRALADLEPLGDDEPAAAGNWSGL